MVHLNMTSTVTALYLVAALLGALFGFVEFRMLWRYVRHRQRIRRSVLRSRPSGMPPNSDGGVPTVTIQLPLYNERDSAERVIRACAEQRYPRDRFDIQVLDDSTDDTAQRVATLVTQLQAEGVRISHLRRSVRTGYKAGALAEGLTQSSADYVAIFDADFMPPPDFLSALLVDSDLFDDPGVAFVQTRWAWDRPVSGVLDSALALLLDRHFFIQKPTRVFYGHVTAFNGSGGIWRRAAIDDAGGWTADTLTEDLDLSYRAALRGWRGHYLHDVPVPNELPRHMRALKAQQRRWAQGTAQSMRKLYGRIFKGRAILQDRFEEMFLLAGYIIHPILMANLLLWPWAVLHVERSFFMAMQVPMTLATLAAPLSLLLTVRERDGRLPGAGSISEILAGMCIGLGLMVNNTVAQIQGLFVTEGEFVRTPKGASASSGLYRLPLHWTFYAEIATVGYCAWGAAMILRAGQGMWAFPMFFWGGCLVLILHLQLDGLRLRPAVQ